MVKKISTLKYIRNRKKFLDKLAKENGVKLFEILYKSINKFHSLNETERYWSIILTPCFWPIHEQLFLIDKINENQFPFLKENFKIPIDCKSLQYMAMNNYLINSLNFLNNSYLKNKSIKEKEIKYFHDKAENLSRNKYVFQIINFFFSLRKNKVVLDLFNLKLFFNLFLNGLSPNIINYNKKSIIEEEYSLEKREKLYNIGLNYCDEETKKKNWYVISHLLPCSIIENFSSSISASKKIFKDNPKKITISNIRRNELENIRIAESVKKKTKLQIFQYGLGALIQHYDFNEIHEQKNSDTFFSWAKSKNNKIIQYPFFYKLKFNKTEKYNGIILINSSWPYFYRSQCGPCFESVTRNYFDQINFVERIKKNFKNVLIKNPNYEFELYKKNSSIFKTINRNEIYQLKMQHKFLTKKPWENFIKNSYFPICSYMGTPFIMLLANDVPNILFSRFSDFNLNDKFSKYMKEYKKFNFYYFHPNKAANFLIKNKEDLYQIWNEKKFKDFRDEFRYEFCEIKNNWQSDFAKKILEN